MKLTLNSNPDGGYDKKVVEEARAFAQEQVAPHAEKWEREGTYPEKTVRQAMAKFGALLVPKSMGGRGETATTFFHVLEEFGKVDIGFSISFVVQCNFTLIVSMGQNAGLRDRYLPDLMTGKRLGSFCLTEPQAGSDAAALETMATKKGDGWEISGRKSWIISAAQAEVVGIFAKTDERPGTGSIALFVSEAGRPGLKAGKPYELISGNATNVTDLTLEKFPVKSDEMMFEPGAGFKAAMQALDAARIGISAICNGALAAGLDHALDYAGKRKAFGSSLLEKQGMQWEFADHVTQLEAARLLTYRAAALLDRGEASPVMSAHAKKFANHAVVDGLVWAMRSMGANGSLRSSPLARLLGGAQLLFQTDGTPEILNLVIGRSLLKSRS
jgi:alkylation response protein AidB-like acyl-CoA dehydrogenase